MPGLLIKDLPRDLHRRLRARAKTNRRSLSSEAITLLERSLADPAGPPSLATIDRLRISGAEPLTQELIDRARQTGRPGEPAED